MDRGYRRHLLLAVAVVVVDDDAAVGRRRASASGPRTGRKWRNRRSCTTRWRWRCIRDSSRSPWPGSSASPANPPASCRRTSSPSNTASRSLRGEVFISLDAFTSMPLHAGRGGRARGGVLFSRASFTIFTTIMYVYDGTKLNNGGTGPVAISQQFCSYHPQACFCFSLRNNRLRFSDCAVLCFSSSFRLATRYILHHY